jgi:hypothetical protein
MLSSAQSRSFIPSMEKFVDGSNGAQYPTANFLLFADSTSMPRFRAGHDTARGIPCEVQTHLCWTCDGSGNISNTLRVSCHVFGRPPACTDVMLTLAAAATSESGWLWQVWYRRLQDSPTNTSLDVDFYFPVDQWLVAREDYHRRELRPA